MSGNDNCEPRKVRRVAGLPFGNITQGGDRSYNNLSVASDLSVGSQAVLPLLYAQEIASLESLEVTVCENLNVAAKDGTFSFANNATVVAGDSISFVANNHFNVESQNVAIDASLDATVSAERNLYLLGDNVVITGNFAVPNVNACSLQCPGGNLTLETNSILVINAPSTAVNGNLAINGNVAVGDNLNVLGNANVAGTLTVCDLMCTGNLGIDTANLILNSNLVTNAVVVNNSLLVSGSTTTTNLTVNNNTTTANIAVSNNALTQNLVVNNNTTTANLTVSNNTATQNLVVNNNTSTANLTVSNNTTTQNLVVNNNTSSANLTVSNNMATNNLVVNNDVDVGGTLNVCDLVCNGNLRINTDNVVLSGNLDVCDVVCANGNLNLNAANVVASGNFFAAGTLSANTIAANNVTTSGDLTVNNLTVNVDANVGNNLLVGNVLNVCNVVCSNLLLVTAPNTNFVGNVRTPLNLTVGGTTQTVTLNVLSGGTFSSVNTQTLNVNTQATIQQLTVNNSVIVTNNFQAANGSFTVNLSASRIQSNNVVVNTNLFVNNLAAQTPGQLLDYNTSTGRVGYVSDGVLAAGAVADNLMGWNTANSTPSKFSITTSAPAQLFTRNTTSGQLISSNFSDVAAIPAANFASLGVNNSSGVVGRAPNFGVVWRNKRNSGDQVVPDATAPVVTYDFQSGIGPFTYSAGTFTCTAAGDYTFLVTCTIDTIAPGSYFILQENGVDLASTGYMSNQITATLVAGRSCALGAVYQVVFVNASGITITIPEVQPLMNDIKIIRSGP